MFSYFNLCLFLLLFNFCLGVSKHNWSIVSEIVHPESLHSSGSCISLVRPLVLPVNDNDFFPFCFSFKGKLGPAGPGVSRTKAMVLQ